MKPKRRRRGPARPRLSRPPLDRMMHIHQAIQSSKYPNATTLSLDLEVSTKSVMRDLDFMRDRFRLPIAYDDRRFGYYYTAEVKNFPTLQVSEGELFALLIAEKALQQYRGTSFEKPLLSALKKMADVLPDTVSLNLSDWDPAISFRTSAEPIIELKAFDALARATSRRLQVELTYRKPGQTKPEQRVVDPYHLANINGEWYLFAYDHLREDLRTFVPARIQSVRLTGHTFVPRQKFSIEKTLRDSFGVLSGKGDYEVVIQFDSVAADYIREKRWHPSQKARELRGGRLEIHMHLSGLDEVARWILSWSGHAVAVAPPELVEKVRSAAQSLLRQRPTPSRPAKKKR